MLKKEIWYSILALSFFALLIQGILSVKNSLLVVQSARSLEGKSLTLDELEQLKNGDLIQELRHQVKNIEAIAHKTKQNYKALARLQEKTTLIEKMYTKLFWHYKFPTTGLMLNEPFYPPKYPFIPHFFSLRRLAPNKGAGVVVAVIDTGVAAFGISDSPYYKANEDLVVDTKFYTQNFNLVSFNGQDPIQQFIHLLKSFTDQDVFDARYLEENLPEWIYRYVYNNDDQPIKNYLQEYGNTLIRTISGQLTPTGLQALKEITTGPLGIKPGGLGVSSIFSVQKMTMPYTKNIIIELLPAARITTSKKTFIAGHGSHVFGLIAAREESPERGVFGIAPEADSFMIKAFQDNGVTTKSRLIAALQKSIDNQAQVVNLSLKAADELDMNDASTRDLERIVGNIPYLVTASGNNGNPRLPGYAGAIEAYPARFVSVPFDVGAFMYQDGKASIAPFSQYEPGIGPLFVAPGYDIISTGLVPGQQENSMYVFMSGTSMATALMSGFVAVMLGEFQEKFTREQLLKVCYCSTIKLHDDSDWHKKVVLGVLDMRMALFMLHVLDALKADGLINNYNKKFDHLLKALQYILFALPQQYSKKHLGDIDFRYNAMAYIIAAQQLPMPYKDDTWFAPSSLEDAISYCTDLLHGALGVVSDTSYTVSPLLLNAVRDIVTKDSIELFEQLDETVRNRVMRKIFYASNN